MVIGHSYVKGGNIFNNSHMPNRRLVNISFNARTFVFKKAKIMNKFSIFSDLSKRLLKLQFITTFYGRFEYNNTILRLTSSAIVFPLHFLMLLNASEVIFAAKQDLTNSTRRQNLIKKLSIYAICRYSLFWFEPSFHLILHWIDVAQYQFPAWGTVKHSYYW